MNNASEWTSKRLRAAKLPASGGWLSGFLLGAPLAPNADGNVRQPAPELWAADPAPTGGPADSAAGDASRTAATDAGRVILVVDDDLLVGMGTAAMLEDLGHVALEATSGADALRLLEARRDIDLVITDHGMPYMSGLELAHAARKLRPALPIILATGYAEPLTGGVPGLLQLYKPFRQDELAKALAAALAQPTAAGGMP